MNSKFSFKYKAYVACPSLGPRLTQLNMSQQRLANCASEVIQGGFV